MDADIYPTIFPLTKTLAEWEAENRARIQQEREAKEKEYERFRNGELPVCGVKVPGLFWMEGSSQLYIAVNREQPGVDAFCPKYKTQVRLARASIEQIARMVEEHEERELRRKAREARRRRHLGGG